MLSFNSLRQRAPELLAVAIPLGIAVAIHGVWILVGSRAAADPKGTALAEGGDSTVVDNTAQLVRITRRAAQQQTLASVGFDLSDTLPSPPGDEETVDLPDEPVPDCPADASAEGSVEPTQDSSATSSSSANPRERALVRRRRRRGPEPLHGEERRRLAAHAPHEHRLQRPPRGIWSQRADARANTKYGGSFHAGPPRDARGAREGLAPDPGLGAVRPPRGPPPPRTGEARAAKRVASLVASRAAELERGGAPQICGPTSKTKVCWRNLPVGAEINLRQVPGLARGRVR